MEIRKENKEKIVVGMTPRYVGIIMTAISLVLVMIVFGLTLGQPRHGGMSRTPPGGGLLAVTLVPAILIFLDWRRNRKEFTMDSSARTVEIVGSKNQTVTFDEIDGFLLGADDNFGKMASRIDIQLKNGQRLSTGVNSSRGNADTVEVIIKKLGERLQMSRGESAVQG